jgi:hypothetical protein
MAFTALEKKVLAKLFWSAEGNGHDFGFIEDARGVCDNKAQLAGVISSLVKKGIIRVWEQENPDIKVTQFTWEDDGDQDAFLKKLKAAMRRP